MACHIAMAWFGWTMYGRAWYDMTLYGMVGHDISLHKACLSDLKQQILDYYYEAFTASFYATILN